MSIGSYVRSGPRRRSIAAPSVCADGAVGIQAPCCFLFSLQLSAGTGGAHRARSMWVVQRIFPGSRRDGGIQAGSTPRGHGSSACVWFGFPVFERSGRMGGDRPEHDVLPQTKGGVQPMGKSQHPGVARPLSLFSPMKGKTPLGLPYGGERRKGRCFAQPPGKSSLPRRGP